MEEELAVSAAAGVLAAAAAAGILAAAAAARGTTRLTARAAAAPVILMPQTRIFFPYLVQELPQGIT